MVIGERHPPSISKSLTILLVAILGMGYLSIAVSTGDLLWFWPAFNGKPASIAIHCEGRPRPVRPGSDAFEQLSVGLNDALWGLKQWQTLSLSEATWNEYVLGDESRVLEYRYTPSATIHSYYRFFKDFDTLIVPLEGRHANANAVFGLKGDLILAGSFRIESNAPLLEVVREHNLCP